MTPHTGKFVSYLRVSTNGQGEYGLGIEGQRQAVADHLNGGAWDLVAEYVEVESGKRDNRPELDAALAICRAYNATLIIAKLDRLSRNASFLLGLRDAGVKFVAVDLPEANTLTVGLMAVMAQHEREAISARTTAALGAIKRQIEDKGSYTTKAGRIITKLGNGGCTLSLADRDRGGRHGRARRAEIAKQKARDLLPIINRVREGGVTTASGIARQLNAENVPTPRGAGKWQAITVQRIVTRAA